MKENLKKIIIEAIFSYETIDLDPVSQTSISVIVSKNKVLVSSLDTGLLVEMTAENLINNFCGKLLVNHITCEGYSEGDWLHNRSYNINNIMTENKSIEDFETSDTVCIMKFTQLLKALCTEALQNDKIYYVNMLYAEGYLSYSTVEDYKASDDYYKLLKEEYELNYDLDEKINETINLLLKA